MTHGSLDDLRALARRHLAPDIAEQWTGLLRPGVGLVPAGPGESVVGRLGGSPALPVEEEWPVWEGHGPLSFIASIDCAAVATSTSEARLPLDIDLPDSGTLLFFYFDGQLDGGMALVQGEDPGSQPGARVLHVPAGPGAETARREAPAGLDPYPEVPLAARVEMTANEPWTPEIQSVFAPDTPIGEIYEHPVCDDAFVDALQDLGDWVGHRIGGYSHAVQNPVQLEVAKGVLGPDTTWEDPRLEAEARRWTLLAQIDTEDAAGMMWGDTGALYWLIRPEDLALRRFDRAVFTWQC
ncbi:YwqG family protein [Streptomyces yaizuensis]|uniref:DUF1963 domain-containing protein n=1 Tax=Streptomyces yaizuensis TaxID=2989713 RepID=A0ABQ5NXW2_9ACTN|nr:YwqG family protein [Streptomyces sp. YSPA8]GLF95079.1 DUF1963 domain-containing protein [Streptomyces sp. YSPA8]